MARRSGRTATNGLSRPASGPRVRVTGSSGCRRLHEAGTEIQAVARVDPARAADGAVTLMERLWPALEQIDTSSGMLGTAVNKAIDELIPFLIAAPADQKLRAKWLERLYRRSSMTACHSLAGRGALGRDRVRPALRTTTSTNSCRCCDEFGLTTGRAAMSSARTFACRHCWRRGAIRTSWKSWR